MNNLNYEIGYEIKSKYSDSIIIDKYMKQGKYPSIAHKQRMTYLCECQRCGNRYELYASEIKKNTGCFICNDRKLEKDKLIAYKNPEIMQYLVNKNDAYMYNVGSGEKVTCECPMCHTQKDVVVSNLCRHGFSCAVCSDGISYPNKFVRAFLSQLNINYENEQSFPWSDGKIYDQYIPSLKIIIENHGMQHYDERSQFSTINISDVKSNDILKKKLALKNGIKYYIELDCRWSEKDYIANSIMNSNLPSLLNFKYEDINWEECELKTATSLKMKVWHDWNLNKNISDLMDKYKLSDTTIRTYINQGYSCGMCDKYVKQFHGKQLSIDNRQGKIYRKPIYCETDNVYFASRFECEKYYPNFFPEKSGSYNLYAFIKKDKPYKGKIFKYITKEEFNNIKKKSLDDNKIIVVGDFFDEVI